MPHLAAAIHHNSAVCVCPILLQPYIIHESPVSELRFEPHLYHCWISCYVHRSIETVRSSQIIWCHHMWWIIFQLMPEMGILIWPEHHISVTSTVIGGTFSNENNILAGCSTWELCNKVQHIAPIHVGTWQYIRKSRAIQPHSQVCHHVVSHCWPLHSKLWWLFPLNIIRECLRGNGSRCAVWNEIAFECMLYGCRVTPRPSCICKFLCPLFYFWAFSYVWRLPVLSALLIPPNFPIPAVSCVISLFLCLALPPA